MTTPANNRADRRARIVIKFFNLGLSHDTSQDVFTSTEWADQSLTSKSRLPDSKLR
jgi:hypothetical protein